MYGTSYKHFKSRDGRRSRRKRTEMDDIVLMQNTDNAEHAEEFNECQNQVKAANGSVKEAFSVDSSILL